ncbi:MAG: hypothetical protein V3U37_02840 [Nitrospinaceae bacterium]
MHLSSVLNLRTQDGDRVNLSFDSEQSFSETQSETRFADGVAIQEFSSVAVAASRYALTVEGDLSEEELAAIRELTQEIAPIAKSFFNEDGFDVEKAREALAGNLGVIQEIELALEKIEVATVSTEEFSRLESVEGAFPVGEIPEVPDAPVEAPPIQNLAELVFAAIDAEFEAQTITHGTDESILRTLGDLLKYIREQLGPILEPLKHPQTPQVSQPEEGSGDSQPVEPEVEDVPHVSELV